MEAGDYNQFLVETNRLYSAQILGKQAEQIYSPQQMKSTLSLCQSESLGYCRIMQPNMSSGNFAEYYKVVHPKNKRVGQTGSFVEGTSGNDPQRARVTLYFLDGKEEEFRLSDLSEPTEQEKQAFITAYREME
jgi:hypothetical protein